MKNIIILGTSGNSIDILDTVNQINSLRKHPIYDCLGFLEDDEIHWGRQLHGVPVLGPLDSAMQYNDCHFVNGIGSPGNFWKKRELIARTGIPADGFETIVHPTAVVSPMSSLGSGTVVFQNAVIASNVKIGNHVIILPNSIISHNDVIGDFTCIAGGACISGRVTIGHSCYVGANSSIIGDAVIGNNCLIAMGSVVLENVSDNSVVAGNPARFLRKTIA